jgi:hypothetical protein
MAIEFEDDYFLKSGSNLPFEPDPFLTPATPPEEPIFESNAGLDALDDLLGGELRKRTRQNLENPEFDPYAYNNPPKPAYDRMADAERAERRNQFLRDNPMEFEKLDPSDQALLGLLQGGADLGRGAAGVADALSGAVPFAPKRVARDYAEEMGRESAAIEDLTRESGTGPGSALQVLSRGATSIVPTFVAGFLGGFPAGIAAAGAQSFGSTFEDAQDGYLRMGEDEETARNKAFVPAIVSGLITAGVTRAFGPNAIEAFRNQLSGEAVAEIIRQPLLSILKGASKEAIEEMTDQVGQAVVQKWSYEPDKKIEDIVGEILLAGGLGFTLGGLAEGANVGFEFLSEVDRRRIAQGTDPIGRTPEYDPTRGNVDERGQVIPNVPLPQAEPVQEPVAPARTLRRGARGVQGAAVKIVEQMGLSPETAQAFVDQWFAGNPQYGDLEQMRSQLIADMEARGLEPENRTLYRDDIGQLLEMGMSEAEAAAMVEQSRAGNEQAAMEARARNAARLSKPVARQMPDAPRQAIPLPDAQVAPVEQEISAPAASPQQTIEALRRAESEGRMPDGRPIDRRERAQWFRDQYNRDDLASDRSWDMLQESIKLDRELTYEDIDKVPDNAAGVKLTGKDGRYVLITKSVKPRHEGVWQTTAFDERGPWMDTNFKSLREAIASWMGEYTKEKGPSYGDKSYKISEVRLKKGGVSNEGAQERLQEQEVQGVQVTPEAVAPVQPEAAATPAPERTLEEERELQKIEKKEQVSSQELQRAEVLKQKAPRKQKEEHSDIIDFIKDKVGKIRGKKTMKPGTEGYYSEAYKEVLRTNAGRQIFTNDGTGQTPDEAVDSLRDAGYLPDGATVDDMWEVILAAVGKRKDLRSLSRREREHLDKKAEQRIEFEKYALNNERKTKKARKNAQPIPVDEMFTGSKLEIDGEEFVVKEFSDNAETGEVDFIIMEDGKRFGIQHVDGSMVIYADEGTYEPSALTVEEAWDPDMDEAPAAEPPLHTTMDAEGQQVLDAGKGGKLKDIPEQDAAAKMAQMKADQSKPLKADGIKIQKDMFGGKDPSAGDIPLFDQDGQKSIGGKFGSPRRKIEGQGTPAIDAMIRSSQLPARAKQVALELLETPLFKNANWDELRFELWDFLQTGAQGVRIGRLIKLSEQADAATFPHEVAHVLFDFLPNIYQNTIEAHRKAALKKAFPAGIPPEFLTGTMTSKEFQDGGYDISLYPLSNASEFLAEYVGDRFASQSFKNRNEPPSAWKKIRAWLEGLVDALRRSIGLKPEMDQVYRELLAGVWQPDLDAIVRAEEQMSYAQNAQQAANAAALAKGPDAKKVEANHLLGQSSNIVDFLNKHGGAVASMLAQRALGFFDYIGIQAQGINLNNGVTENYQQVKARVTNPEQRNWIARFASIHVNDFEVKLKEAIEEGNKALARLTSKPFVEKLVRLAKYEAQKNTIKNMDAAASAMLESAMRKAVKTLREEAKTDLEIAGLEGQIEEIAEAMQSSSAMSLLMQDMVKVIASTPQGQQALQDPNVTRAELVRIYKDIKRSTGQPLFNENLMRWASYVLQRNAEVRDELWAAQLGQNSQIKAQMGPYEKWFLAELEKSPVATMKRELRAMKKRTTDYERARFAYLTLNKEVMNELGKLQSQVEAGEIAQNILNDPDFKAYRTEVFKDAGVEGTQRPYIAWSDKLLILPDGREVNVDPEFMKGSQQQFQEVYDRARKAEADLEVWLNNNANLDNPNYSVHRRNLTEIQNYLTQLGALRPTDTERMWNTAMTIVRDASEVAGGRLKDPVLKALNAWNRTKEKAGWWNQKWSYLISEARGKAIKSHGIKWGLFRENDLLAANQQWWDKVGNFLHYTHQLPTGALKVGDLLPSGERVTQEDMDQLKLQAQATTAGFDIIKDFQLTEDSLGRAQLFRKAMKGSENMVRRVFNDRMKSFAKEYAAARKGFQDAFRAKDQAAMTQFENQMIAILNRNWDRIGFAFTWDRNADFAQQTIFDGENGVFDAISKRWMGNPNYIQNFDQLIDEIVARTTNVTRDEAKQIVMVEWGRIINDWNTAVDDDTSGRMVAPVRGKDAQNATTKSRNKMMAPYSFYEHGFKDSRSIAVFAGGLHSAPLDRVVAGMVAMRDDLRRQIDALKDAPNRTKAINDNAIRRKNGQTYDNLQNLEKRLSALSGVLDSLTSYDPDQDVDITFGRTIGAATGLMISGSTTTMRNFTTGPLYMGAVLNNIYGSTFKGYLWSYWYAYSTGIQVGASVGLSGLVLGPGRFMLKVPKAMMELAKGNFRKAYSIPMREFIHEVGHNSYMRVKLIKELVDKKLLFLPDLAREFEITMELSAVYQGKIPAHEMSRIQKGLNIPAAMLEQTVLAIAKTFAPLAGDISLNASTYKALTRRASRELDLRLRKLFEEYQRTGYRQFNFNDVRDPINLLSPQELFPGTAPAKAEKMFSDLRISFARAGMNLDEITARFMGELSNGNARATVLTDAEMQNVAAKEIDDINRPSATGSPRVFMKNDFIHNLIKPFMSWKVRALAIFLRALSIPSQAKATKMALWGATALMAGIAILFNAAIQSSAEETDRAVKRVLFNMEKSYRQPWEREGLKSQSIGWVLQGTLGIPFIDMAMNAMFNDLPVRSSMLPELAMISKAQDINRYIGGVLQTGDPFFRLPELISSFVPDTRAILNRLSSQSGKRLSGNALALMRRHGNTELLREVGESPAGVNYNELSPYGPKLENAAMNGDMAEFRRLFNEAVEIAKEKGRPDPDKAVRNLFSHRNPWDRAFKSKLSTAERDSFMARLSDRERQMIIEMEKRFATAAQEAGASFNVVKDRNSPLGLGRGSSLASLGANSRRSRGGRSLSLSRRRSNLRRTTSSSLRRGAR